MTPKGIHFIATAVSLFLVFAGGVPCVAQRSPDRRVWTVEGREREALVYGPVEKTDAPPPILFAFHGHGGSMETAADTFRFHELWPRAVVIYPQGLKTPGPLVDPEGKKSGWQTRGGEQSDRDLAFFDAMLADVRREFSEEGTKVFAAGHSNGGSFVYLLWASRPDALAGAAPSACVAVGGVRITHPVPLIHTAGKQDPLVKLSWQERTINVARRVNGCGPGTPWGDYGVRYPSPTETPVIVCLFPGGHEYPPEASTEIVRFFREIADR